MGLLVCHVVVLRDERHLIVNPSQFLTVALFGSTPRLPRDREPRPMETFSKRRGKRRLMRTTQRTDAVEARNTLAIVFVEKGEWRWQKVHLVKVGVSTGSCGLL